MNATQSFMDNTEWIERYSWFGAMRDMQGVNEVFGRVQNSNFFRLTSSQYDRIMDTDGGINALGLQYIGAVPPNTTGNYIPGVVSGGDGGQPGNNGNIGNSPPRINGLLSALSPLAVALFIALLI